MSTPGNHHSIIIEDCPRCGGEGRDLGAPSKWGDGSPTDYGPCRTCKGTGEVETEYECRTLDELEDEIDIEREAMTDFNAVR